MTWQNLDRQMQIYATQLKSLVRLETAQLEQLATVIAEEIKSLPQSNKDDIFASSPIHPKDRLLELKAFQNWMDIARKRRDPFLSRAQVITQSYICFVYLPESCFKILFKSCPSGSAARKCSKFLTNNPVRAYRNAIAHANWTYSQNCTGITYWAKKDSCDDETLIRFEVSDAELGFWQALSRCVAYVTYTTLVEN